MRTEETRLVLDTNTLISRMLVPQGTAGRAVDKALAQGDAAQPTMTLVQSIPSCCSLCGWVFRYG
ncbi:MAG: hypothetical protein EA372_03785, partial [Chromatiaceae bacterium]